MLPHTPPKILLHGCSPSFYGNNPFEALLNRGKVSLGLETTKSLQKKLYERSAQFVWENRDTLRRTPKDSLIVAKTSWWFYRSEKNLTSDALISRMIEVIRTPETISSIDDLQNKTTTLTDINFALSPRRNIGPELTNETIKAVVVTSVKTFCREYSVSPYIAIPLSGASKSCINGAIAINIAAEVLATYIPLPPGILGSCVRTGLKGATSAFLENILNNYTTIEGLHPTLKYAFIVLCMATFKAGLRFFLVFACGSDELGMILGSIIGQLIIHVLYANSDVRTLQDHTKSD